MGEHPQRILLCIPALDGGPGRVLLNLLRHLDRDLYQVVLGVSEPGRLLAEVPDDVEIVRVGHPGQRYPTRSLAYVVRKLAPDVVLTTLRMSFTALAASPIFPRGTKLVVRQANHVTANQAELAAAGRCKGSLIDLAYTVLLRRADLVICQSRAMRADVAHHVSHERLAILSNPVDVGGIRALADAGDVNASQGFPTLITVGRLSRQKGYDLLLPAFARLIQQVPRARLWILGEGPEAGALARQAETLGIDDSIELLGFQSNPYPYLSSADIFVSSSRYEGLPNAVLEAFACGTPAVATSGPGAGDDLVVPGLSGWLARPESAHALADTLLEATQAARTISRNELSDWCEEHFGAANVARQYETVLSGVLCRDSLPRVRKGVVGRW